MIGEGTPPVPAKLVKQIQSGQFVDFTELLPDNLELLRRLPASSVSGANEDGHCRLPQVSSLGTWVQCFAVYAAFVLRAAPDRALDLMAYLQLVVHEDQCHSAQDGYYMTRASRNWLLTRQRSPGVNFTRRYTS